MAWNIRLQFALIPAFVYKMRMITDSLEKTPLGRLKYDSISLNRPPKETLDISRKLVQKVYIDN